MINLYYGPVVNPQTLTHYLALPRCLIAVGSDGNIIWVEDDVEAEAIHNVITTRGLKPEEYNVVDFSAKHGEFIMPGLIDTHVHACQFPIMGVGGDLPLLDWLYKYVFPTEAKFEDKAYAESAYNDVIDRSIASGTTTSCYYGSLHLDATIILADIIHRKGQRALVGKCSMDWNCPGYYIDRTAEASLQDTIDLIKYVEGLSLSHANEPLVRPVITPRFALSCSEKLLTDLGELAKLHPHIPIQTHVSENRKEVEETLRRFGAESYSAVYDRFGLLRNNTILGHGVWLTEEEMDLLAARGTGVAHCPGSNFFLGSGMARVGLLLDHGVKVGLGTDVSGGYNPSILNTIQMASTASKMVAVQAEVDKERREQRRAHRCCRHGKHGKRGKHGRRRKEDMHDHAHASSDESSDSDSEVYAEAARPNGHKHGARREPHHTHRRPAHGHDPFANQKLRLETLLYLATLGGAHVCCLQDRVGSFAPGKAFDALHITLSDATGNPAVWGRGVDEAEMVPEEKNIRRWLERFFFGGDNRNLKKVWVQGVVVGGTDKPGSVADRESEA